MADHSVRACPLSTLQVRARWRRQRDTQLLGKRAVSNPRLSLCAARAVAATLHRQLGRDLRAGKRFVSAHFNPVRALADSEASEGATAVTSVMHGGWFEIGIFIPNSRHIHATAASARRSLPTRRHLGGPPGQGGRAWVAMNINM